MKTNKVLLCLLLLSIFVLTSSISAFADTSGNGVTDTNTSYNGGAPNLIMFGDKNFALNNYACSSANDNYVGNSFVVTSVPWSNGLQYKLQSTYIDYIDYVYVFCDELIFTMPGDDFEIVTPRYLFESANHHFSIASATLDLTNIHTIDSLGNVVSYPDLSTELEVTPYRASCYYSDVTDLLSSAYIEPGVVVYCTPSMSYDVEYDSGDKFYFYSYTDYTGFDGNLVVPIFPSYETVDVLSWLPSTIDSFLNVDVLPGVNFGTLLLMVIAVPAIFAVLKMLGGGG